MKKNVFFLIILMISCSSPEDRESKLISDYLYKITNMTITSGDIILINSDGCEGCIEEGLAYLEQNNLYNHYKVLIISQEALDKFDKHVNQSKFIVDRDNIVQRLNISHSGFVVIKLEESNIDTIFSLNPTTDLNLLKQYSK